MSPSPTIESRTTLVDAVRRAIRAQVDAWTRQREELLHKIENHERILANPDAVEAIAVALPTVSSAIEQPGLREGFALSLSPETVQVHIIEVFRRLQRALRPTEIVTALREMMGVIVTAPQVNFVLGAYPDLFRMSPARGWWSLHPAVLERIEEEAGVA